MLLKVIKLLPRDLPRLVGSIPSLSWLFLPSSDNNAQYILLRPSSLLAFQFTRTPQGKEAVWPQEASLKSRTKELKSSINSLAEVTFEFNQVILKVSKEPVGPEIGLSLSFSFLPSVLSLSTLTPVCSVTYIRDKNDKKEL